MITVEDAAGDHDRYIELCALATSGTLSSEETNELQAHLVACSACRETYEQFKKVASEGMPLLAADYELPREDERPWNESGVRDRLLATIGSAERAAPWRVAPTLNWNLARVGIGVLAACVVIAVGAVAYRAWQRGARATVQMTSITPQALPPQNFDGQEWQVKLRASAAQVEALQRESKQKQAEIGRLDNRLKVAEVRVDELAATSSASSEQLQLVSSERDSLADQLQRAQQAYRTVQERLDTIQGQYSQTLVKMASLESNVQNLSARVREQDQTIADREQYLSSDRDIRELMGARQLYIADVYDVDNSGKTRKPFGRVFYTKSKSLVFYAFDLDQQPHVKNASAFQVWGQRVLGQAKPLNLGILYMDNETNRRWALRFDDPAKLADVDAIFVTVEPNGGSNKPTGKPFLYASLQKLANHP
ncbi:MAG: hypothetical protein LAO30_06250 [Acidobacteriia bacterium]|nr:hypothetical protein [Terriglobia bacterium]